MTDARSRLLPFLRKGERILWVGQPDPKVRFASADLFLVPFSVLWGGFVLFWESAVIASRAPLFFVLWGIPFILAGLYITVGRFIYKKRRKLATVYGVTDSRAIVSSNDRSFAGTPIRGTPMRINRSRDGRHVSVIFGSGNMLQTAYQNTGMDLFSLGMGQGTAFFDVADPDALMRALDQVQ